MLQGNPNRKNTLRRIKSVFKQKKELNFQEHIAPPLKTVSLPPTIPDLTYMSPKLWNWITTDQQQRIPAPRVFSPAGEILHGGLPPHLQDLPPPLPASDRPLRSIMSDNMNVHPNAFKQIRKPPVNENESRYLLVNIKNISLPKLNFGNEVIGLVSMDDQKRCTSVLRFSKSYDSNGSYYIAQASQGFLYEIPESKKFIVLSVRLYSKAGVSVNPSQMSLSSGTMLNKSFSFLPGLKRNESQMSFADNSSTMKYVYHEEILAPADASMLGDYLGEYSTKIPCDQPFSKLDMDFHIPVSRKETSKLVLSAGLFFDAPYAPLPDVPKDLEVFLDYLNFQLRTRGGLIWDKKWVVASSTGLMVYSFAYREEKPPFAWIPYTQMVGIKNLDRIFMAASNCFVLTLALPWQHDSTVFTPSATTISWKDQVTDAGKENGKTMDIYLMADDNQRMAHWKSFLQFHISRNQPKRGK